jgi:hypothetical protein
MAANKILLVFIFFDLVFLLCAGLHLFIPLYTKASITNNTNVNNVASNLLLDHCPLLVTMVVAVVMFITFVLSLPALIMKTNRSFLQWHAWGIVLSALMTLGIGLTIWFQTLETHKNLKPLWENETPEVRSMLQAKFDCCGYDNTALFTKDDTCTTAATAANLGSCMVPFGVFANQFLDIVFTTFFGFVAVDMMLLLSALCLIKDRKEKERYRLIDGKRGWGPI